MLVRRSSIFCERLRETATSTCQRVHPRAQAETRRRPLSLLLGSCLPDAQRTHGASERLRADASRHHSAAVRLELANAEGSDRQADQASSTCLADRNLELSSHQ